jgi:hypothetical protein
MQAYLYALAKKVRWGSSYLYYLLAGYDREYITNHVKPRPFERGFLDYLSSYPDFFTSIALVMPFALHVPLAKALNALSTQRKPVPTPPKL